MAKRGPKPKAKQETPKAETTKQSEETQETVVEEVEKTPAEEAEKETPEKENIMNDIMTKPEPQKETWKDEVVTKTKKEGFKLPNKTVIVQPIFRNGFLPKGHEANFLFKHAKNKFELPRLMVTGSYKDPFSSDEERKYLEKFLGLDLNPFDEKNNYFKGFSVALGKDPITLDLSHPEQYLQYLVLKANTEYVTTNYEQRNRKQTYKYVIIDKDAQDTEALERVNQTTKAYETLTKINKSPSDLRALLIADNKSVSPQTKVDFLTTEVFKMFEERRHTFLALTSDLETVRYKALIFDAIRMKAIVVTGMKAYALPDTPGVIANSEGELISWFKDPENSEEVARIRHRAGYTK